MLRPTAVRVQPAFPDVAQVRSVIEAAGPFWPLSRYAASTEELQALGNDATRQFTPPWFRQDFAFGRDVLVDGAEIILANERFADAARTIYGDDTVVVPTTVYVNVMGPTPFPFAPHLDVPAFRGFTRADHPIWLLKTMQSSGLFESWRTRIATAVSWIYDGPGGDFHYWPDGPDAAGAVERPPFDNVAVVADNEATFHGVAPLGPPGHRLPKGLDHSSQLVRGDGGWDVVHGDEIVAHYPDAMARITISWKADVVGAGDRGGDELDLDRVVDGFRRDLAARGVDAPAPADPHRDREWVALLAAHYHDRAPALPV